MKICVISDTHNEHDASFILPDADVIIHCGDVSLRGSDFEVREFFRWYSSLTNYKHRIMISGNHDRLFELALPYVKSYIPDNITYLEDSSVNVMGVNIYGSPVTPKFFNWAFGFNDNTLVRYWDKIPTNTDILVTHGPPYGILDIVKQKSEYVSLGSVSLRDKLDKINPKYHLFGHIHEGYGMVTIKNTTYVNASSMNDKYQMVNKPIVIEI